MEASIGQLNPRMVNFEYKRYSLPDILQGIYRRISIGRAAGIKRSMLVKLGCYQTVLQFSNNTRRVMHTTNFIEG